ncbi:MAG TPA: IPT/TIG domain-containing protein [Bryobacteraceae bacterium]|nr:IPT/TIG domain-containing protein [Bryobacteraceae bacterium]
MNSFFILFVLALAGGAGIASAQMTVVNGASFDSTQPMAPGSFATIFGQNLCGQTAAGNWIAPGQLPTSLGSCSVAVNGMPAMLLYVSPGQINFVVPQNLGPGSGSVVVNNGSQALSGTMMVGQAGPGIFAMSGMGVGEGAMLHGTMWSAGPFSTTTNGQATPVAMFCTGLDLSTKPAVSIGGMMADVTWSGNAPGYVGLQQININLPAGAAGSGRAPVMVTSDGQGSNVTFMTILPTNAMMQGMPGWGSGMMLGENAPRAHEVSFLAANPANNTALVTDENDDVVRVISLDSGSTTATITLPQGSQAHEIAVNAAGTLAAATLSAKGSVALIDLKQNQAAAVVATGNYPSHVVFSGANLLVTNGAGGTVSVIDTNARAATQTIPVGFGPSGIDASATVAVVANFQAGSLSLINLVNYSVTPVSLPAGARPYDVAVSAAANKAVITTPMSSGFLILDLGTRAITAVDTGVWNTMGPGSVVTNGSLAYLANPMTASVTVADLAAGKVVKTFPVDPGPRALAVNPNKNQLLVLAEGTGTLDVVDLGSSSIVSRLNAGATERQGTWALPVVSSISPNSAQAGASFTLTIAGANFQGVNDLEFEFAGLSSGGGMMGGGMGSGMGPGMGSEDPNIKISNVQVNSAGTQITASVQILGSAAAGTRVIRLETGRGEVMGPMTANLFTVTR